MATSSLVKFTGIHQKKKSNCWGRTYFELQVVDIRIVPYFFIVRCTKANWQLVLIVCVVVRNGVKAMFFPTTLWSHNLRRRSLPTASHCACPLFLSFFFFFFFFSRRFVWRLELHSTYCYYRRPRTSFLLLLFLTVLVITVAISCIIRPFPLYFFVLFFFLLLSFLHLDLEEYFRIISFTPSSRLL